MHGYHAWRGAQLPAVNGHGTARANARLYGALACGGSVDGVCVLSTEARVGFGYLPNMLGMHIQIDPRAQRLIEAVYAVIRA